MSFRKAQKEQGKLRLAIGAPAGCGKTWTSLAIATALGRMTRESGLGEGRIALIDSERGSSELYADTFSFDVCNLDSFSPLEYVAKIRDAERAGYDLIVIDSLSHAWAGKDGALEQQTRASQAQGANKFTAWASVTPKQNQLIDAMTGSSSHVIATMRQKTEFVQEKDEAGKVQIRKVGLQFVQRDQIDFEFTLVGEIDREHTMTISKTRIKTIPLNSQHEKPGESLARELWSWLRSGAAPTPHPVAPVTASAVADALDDTFKAFLKSMVETTTQAELDAVVAGPNKPPMGTAERAKANEVYGLHSAALRQRNGASAS
jgi:hypothetical protein